jgi:alpha-galactosidase
LLCCSLPLLFTACASSSPPDGGMGSADLGVGGIDLSAGHGADLSVANGADLSAGNGADLSAGSGSNDLAGPGVVDLAVAGNDLATTTTTSGIVSISNGNVRLDYDADHGTATFYYGGVAKISGFYAGVQLTQYVTSKQYTQHSVAVTGTNATVTSTGGGLPTMQQLFWLNGGNKLLTRVTLQGTQLSTNWIAPIVMDTKGGVDVGSYGDSRLLWMPWDNDAWVYYNAGTMNSSGTSFNAAAFYDNTGRNGIVVGAVTHDTWKTGVYYSGSNNRLDALNVFGGATDATYTHDVLPHGKVTADTLYSPIVFMGYSSDWRDLLEEYASANTAIDAKLPWSGGVPFGWNSWGKIQSSINYDKAIAVSDYIAGNLQNNTFNNNGAVYVNLDSYWDNMSDTQLTAFVAHCHANGQKAGIYWAPFVDWGLSDTRQVEGTASTTYGQIWLRDGSGNPIKVDGAYAVDPTHAGTKQRIDYMIDRFKNMGFEYIKLDFLSHGALESSVRADPAVQTGIQAYNQGMQYLLNRIGGTMFISESISPLFPYKYAHARRLSCDTYGADTGQGSTQYELNSLSYGWWMNSRLYTYNDPDEMLFEGFSANANMSRLVSGAISGTVFLNGDDLTEATGQGLAKTRLTNSNINWLASLGNTFRPLEGNTGTGAADVYAMSIPGSTFLAVFNFGSGSTTKSISLARAGLDPSHSYWVQDMWTSATTNATGTLSVSVDGNSAALLHLY